MQIPVYNQQTTIAPQPTVREAPVADANAFGANVAQSQHTMADALCNVSKVDMQIIQENQLKQNQQAVFDSYNTWSDKMTELQTGYLSKQGNMAKGITIDANKNIGELNNKFVTKFDNKAQQQAFTQMINPLFMRYKMNIASHESQQSDVALNQSTQALITNSANRIASNPLSFDMNNTERANTQVVINHYFGNKCRV